MSDVDTWVVDIHDARDFRELDQMQAIWSRAIWRDVYSPEDRARKLAELAAVTSIARARWEELVEHLAWTSELRVERMRAWLR
jgi:hypothetical protein